MSLGEPVETGWTECLRNGTTPTAEDVREHLDAVHRKNAGFTEECAGRCCDAEGRTSYRWLAEIVPEEGAPHVLDLGCGSGVLLDELRRSRPGARLTGLDLSEAELAKARTRVGRGAARLIQGTAQDLSALDDAGVDAVLCHWALTLMAPVEPVLHEVARVTRPGGAFAAIVDGPPGIAPGYEALDRLIFGHVQKLYPDYGRIELGDARTRRTEDLLALAREAFPGAEVSIEPNVVTLEGPADNVAREAVGFYYAAYVLGREAAELMIEDAARFFSDRARGGPARFAMPINRLLVRF